MIIALPKLAAEAVGSILASDMQRAYGSSHTRLTELIPMAARVALDCIGISDALYHNVEHAMLVTLVARDIAYGRWLLVPTTPEDDAHLFVARLMHDIGYVRGILKGDESGYVIDDTGQKVSLPRGSSDAALEPYHVDRSNPFVLDRVKVLDAAVAIAPQDRNTAFIGLRRASL